MIKLGVALCFLALNFYVYHWFATEEVIPPRMPFAEFPLELGSWRCAEKGEIAPEVLANLGASDYLICTYRDAGDEAVVDTYVGYHETQVRKEGGGAGENSIHPPEHCLPGSGWDVIDARIVPLELPGPGDAAGQPFEAKRFVIAKGNARQLVYFWYQSRGRILARNHEVILYRFWDRATRGRTDGSLVRLTIPIGPGGEKEAERAFRAFAEGFVRELPTYVPS